MAKSGLALAENFFRKRRFANVVRVLEPNIRKYHDSYRAQYLMGSSCLFLGDFGGAQGFFLRAIKLRETNDIECSLALAAIELQKGDWQKAVEYILKSLEDYPNNRKLHKALNSIKLYSQKVDNGETDKKKVLSGLYPKTGLNLSPLLATAIVIASVAIIFFGAKCIIEYLGSIDRHTRVEALALPSDLDELWANRGNGIYSENLSETELATTYQRAIEYFNAYRDNRARIELNRILNSNASEKLISRARFIVDQLFRVIPRIIDFNDSLNIPYTEIDFKKLYLYEGCYVVWKGMIANIAKTENKGESRFELFINYDKDHNYLGKVDVLATDAQAMDSELTTEVLGKIKIVKSAIILQGLTIHQF